MHSTVWHALLAGSVWLHAPPGIGMPTPAGGAARVEAIRCCAGSDEALEGSRQAPASSGEASGSAHEALDVSLAQAIAAPPPPPFDANFDDGMSSAPGHRAGFVSILGVPNVGKSTLMNALVGERLSIATAKAQTTRHRIMGILNDEDYQIVYSDTPGVLQPQYRLQEGMMRFVRSSINDADVLLLVVDIFQGTFPDEQVLRQLRASPASLLVLLNKVDLLEEDSPLGPVRRAEIGTKEEALERLRGEFPDATVLPLCAKGGDGVDEVLKRVLALLPIHPPYFPKDQMTDKPERFFAAEMLREAIFEVYEQEIPYSCECSIDAFKESEDLIRIRAHIYVSHDSQKGIVIGKRGAALKKVGVRTRKRLEDFFQKQCYLETRVKVRPNWRQDDSALKEFGYIS